MIHRVWWRAWYSRRLCLAAGLVALCWQVESATSAPEMPRPPPDLSTALAQEQR
jgi:hypothetical protein